MFVGRQMDKEDVVHIHNGILLEHRKGMKLGHLQRRGWTSVLLYFPRALSLCVLLYFATNGKSKVLKSIKCLKQGTMGESRAGSAACFPYEKGRSHDHNSFPHIKCSFANLWAISMLDFTTSCKIYLNLSSELCIDAGGITVLSGRPFPMTRSPSS